jgi:hypothetical protein
MRTRGQAAARLMINAEKPPDSGWNSVTITAQPGPAW